VQFHILSFEGPDAYARAGGIASRVTGLAQTLADQGFETHLWFVGAPDLAGEETLGTLHLHRWCQWISHYHPAGVYDGEEGKRADYAASLPPYLLREVLWPYLQAHCEEPAVILAEEWHTVDAVLHLDWLLREAHMRHRVTMLWNANNTFAFERIDWAALAASAVITTVSRYMKHLMRGYGVDPLVIPNGLSDEALLQPEREAVNAFRNRARGRTVLCKVARWDPDKHWLLAIHIVQMLKQHGWQPLLIARGGVEAHGMDVLQAAAAAELRVVDCTSVETGVRGLLHSMAALQEVDIVNLRSPLDVSGRRVLFCGSAAVLANSSHEPFGLVGLETMAVGGVACTGSTGEDYVVPGLNALVLETADPQEFIALFGELRANPDLERAVRRAGRATAKRYAWTQIMQQILLPRVRLLAGGLTAQGGQRARHETWVH
jgi:glycosyltransferase involved in cell wall biosynthesis